MQITFVLIIVVVVIIFLLFTFKKLDFLKNNAIKNLENGINSIYKVVDKESNIYYIEDLKSIKLQENIDISDLDNNITTINIKNKYNYTFKVSLCNNICMDLQATIEYLFVEGNCFVVCFKKKYVGALIFNKNNIIISNQNFAELEDMRTVILKYIHNHLNAIIQEDKDE